MTSDVRDAIRAQIDTHRRAALNVEWDTRIHGIENTYRNGCRCDDCRAAATQLRAQRRRNALEKAKVVDRTSDRWQRIRSALQHAAEGIDLDTQADQILQDIQRRGVWQ